MVQRRANDAQVERLLAAMVSKEYRQALARKVAGVPAGKLPQKGSDKRRSYDSAMRRFERYVAPEGKQRRSFTAARAEYRAPVVVAARRVPLPDFIREAPPIPKRVPTPAPVERPRPTFYEDIPRSPLDAPRRSDPVWDVDLYDLRTILAYYDGDANEAAQAMAEAGDFNQRQEHRMARLLELTESGVDVLGMDGSGVLQDAYRNLLDALHEDDRQDIEDFNALLHNLPDWQIEMILADMQEGDSTFADWMDAWRDSDMDMDSDENDYWQLWREAYARAKK